MNRKLNHHYAVQRLHAVILAATMAWAARPLFQRSDTVDLAVSATVNYCLGVGTADLMGYASNKVLARTPRVIPHTPECWRVWAAHAVGEAATNLDLTAALREVKIGVSTALVEGGRVIAVKEQTSERRVIGRKNMAHRGLQNIAQWALEHPEVSIETVFAVMFEWLVREPYTAETAQKVLDSLSWSSLRSQASPALVRVIVAGLTVDDKKFAPFDEKVVQRFWGRILLDQDPVVQVAVDKALMTRSNPKKTSRHGTHQYEWLPLDQIEPFVTLMERRGVSKVARSPRGFLTAYRGARGVPERLGYDNYSGQEWVRRRNNFVARHMGQIKSKKEPLWEGQNPSRRHLALIAWAYTPDPDGVSTWVS